MQGSRAHQAQARAHGQGHKASPDLFSWVSSWNQVPIPVFSVFSQISTFSKAFVCRGRTYITAKGPLSWVSSPVFLIFSQISILSKAFAYKGRACGQPSYHPEIPIQSNPIPSTFSLWCLIHLRWCFLQGHGQSHTNVEYSSTGRGRAYGF